MVPTRGVPARSSEAIAGDASGVVDVGQHPEIQRRLHELQSSVLGDFRSVIYRAAAVLGVAVGVSGFVYTGYGIGRVTNALRQLEERSAAEEKRQEEIRAWQEKNQEIVKELWSLGIPELKEREEGAVKTAKDNQNLTATLRAVRVAKERISGETMPAGESR